MPGPVSPRRLRVVLAEDAALLREGLVAILERAGHEVAAAVGDADALLAYTEHAAPDLVVTDIRMPPDHTDEGLRAAAAIRAAHPDIAIMVLSAYIADAYVAELLDNAPGGGIGYLLKDRVGHVRDFLDSLDRVAAGETVVDPEVVRQLLRRRRTDGPLAALTVRERDVLGLMAEGRTTARSPRPSWSARPPCASTSAASSRSCRSTPRPTGGSRPCSPTCAAETPTRQVPQPAGSRAE